DRGHDAADHGCNRPGIGLESCYRMSANDESVFPMISPTTRSQALATSAPVHPALQRRTALRERRPKAVRRHTGRVATRFAVLLVGDVVAALLARVVALWLVSETSFGAVALPGTPLLDGGTRFAFLSVITLLAVFATGGHSR